MLQTPLDPMLAGFLRGLVLAIASAAILFGINFLNSGVELPSTIQMLTPILLVALRTVEGYVDRLKAQTPPVDE